MLSIKEALQKDNNEDVTLQVKVMQFLQTDKSSSGKENKLYIHVIGDESGTCKIRLFKREDFDKFDQLPSLIIQNVIKKPDFFIFTVRSKASFCKEVIPNNQKLSNAVPPEPSTLNEAMVRANYSTIKCRVVHVSPVKDRTSSYSGQPLQLRHLIVKDDTRHAKLAPWNDAATEQYSRNDVIQVTNMKNTTFNKTKLIGSTPISKVEFLPDNGAYAIIEKDYRLIFEDADFSPCNKLSGKIIGYDNINVYSVCPKHACLNKELKDGICPNCFTTPDKDKKYVRATITIQQESGIKDLSIFYPENSALCAYMELNADLHTTDSVTKNFKTFLGQEITFNLKKSSISNISLKRKHHD